MLQVSCFQRDPRNLGLLKTLSGHPWQQNHFYNTAEKQCVVFTGLRLPWWHTHRVCKTAGTFTWSKVVATVQVITGVFTTELRFKNAHCTCKCPWRNSDNEKLCDILTRESISFSDAVWQNRKAMLRADLYTEIRSQEKEIVPMVCFASRPSSFPPPRVSFLYEIPIVKQTED